jgi:hypothetical protein
MDNSSKKGRRKVEDSTGPAALCAVCGKPLEAIMASLGMLSHPSCSVTGVEKERDNPASVNPFTAPGDSPDPDLAADLKAELMTMVRMYEEFQPRKMQLALGPSDLGVECDRRLAYKIAGVTGYNTGDPWAAFVGSSIHTRLEHVIKKYAERTQGDWLIEQMIQVTPEIRGKADLIHGELVIDIKSASPDVMKKLPDTGPRASYLPQIHSYAYGLNASGHKITKVAFAFVPRSGRLDDMYVWADKYRPEIAEKALARVYRFARRLEQLDILNNPDLWETVPPNPDYLWCQYCPLFNKGMGANDPASDKGCAGYKMQKKEKYT